MNEGFGWGWEENFFGVILWVGKLDLLAICWFVVAVRGMLKTCRQGMLELMESMLDIIWNWQVEFFLPASSKTLIQKIIGVFLYYGIAFDLTMLVALGTLATQKSKPT